MIFMHGRKIQDGAVIEKPAETQLEKNQQAKALCLMITAKLQHISPFLEDASSNPLRGHVRTITYSARCTEILETF
jgi:hypothetical protein